MELKINLNVEETEQLIKDHFIEKDEYIITFDGDYYQVAKVVSGGFSIELNKIEDEEDEEDEEYLEAKND